MKVIKEQKEFHVSIKEVVYASMERRFLPSIIPSRIRAAKGTETHRFLQDKRKKTPAKRFNIIFATGKPAGKINKNCKLSKFTGLKTKISNPNPTVSTFYWV